MLDPESIPLLAKLNITKVNTPSMLVVNPQARSLLEVRRNIRRKLKLISILLSICQDKLFLYRANSPILFILQLWQPLYKTSFNIISSLVSGGKTKYNPTL